MKLSELTNIINYSFDFADDEIDATFYMELEDILPKYAKQIEVKEINKNYVICDFSKFIREHKTRIKKYIYDTYYIAWASSLYRGIYEEQDPEFYYELIKNDLETILTQEK